MAAGCALAAGGHDHFQEAYGLADEDLAGHNGRHD
jgi:hypothetical protein